MKLSKLHIVLFIATVITTFSQGYLMSGDLFDAMAFCLSLILILASHEMGHYLFGRRYGADITPPYFIPAPPEISPIGTFGAFIKIRSGISTKKALFDIGVAGPIAGIVVALPVLFMGLELSKVVDISNYNNGTGFLLGSSPLFSFFSHIVFGNLPEGKDIVLHPLAFAGWVGLFVTALNLIPSGQLDGGHVIYSVFNYRIHRLTSIIAIITLTLIGLGTKPILQELTYMNINIGLPEILIFNGWPGWLIWAILLTIMGPKHPPTLHEENDIGLKRKIIALLTMLIFIGCFSPVPIALN